MLGRTVGIDATTLEANAAMLSIVRRDRGESDDACLARLAEAFGLSTPTRAEVARLDRIRKKKGSNKDWTHPHDPDAKIAKVKDGCTRLTHAAEQVEAIGSPGIMADVADMAYHSNETMVGFATNGVRSDISELDRGRRHWNGQAAARDAVSANLQRMRSARGIRLLRQRS